MDRFEKGEKTKATGISLESVHIYQVQDSNYDWQVYSHLDDRLQLQIVAIQNSYSSVLMADLQRLYSSLNQALKCFMREKDDTIEELSKQNHKFDKLQGDVQKLR